MIGYMQNNRGRYKCSFCDHSTYRTQSGIYNHLDTKHATELALARKDEEIRRLKSQPPKVKIEERIVYKEKPKPQYWYGPEGIYCSSCKTVITRPGIPVGQTIENTPCACGNKTLMLITEFK